jgi:multidrug efflux system membrane fusion protein
MLDGRSRRRARHRRGRLERIRIPRDSMSTPGKLLLGVLALVAVAAGSGIAVQAIRESRVAAPKAGPAAVPVTAAAAVTRTMPLRLTAIGTVEAFTTVAVKARVDGEIVKVGFAEGDPVRTGQLLFEIDPRPFAAALKQAQANLAKDRALYDRAAEQEKRYKDLLQKNFISADAYDQVRTNLETAGATIAADNAAIDGARLSLDYCTIRSPITGYAGRIQIQQGNLVKANDANPLVVINQVVPVYVSFSVPEHDLAEIRRYQANGELRVLASLPNSGHPPASGRLSFVDNAADPATGTIRLKAEFPNADKALWPGQFADVVLILHEQTDALVIPTAAIQNGPDGQYVFVVRPDKTVELRAVKIARADGSDAVVASGLAAGESVVTAGQLRLAPGTRVRVDSAAPAP